MTDSGKITRLFGCISTGKEANVYLAKGTRDLVNHEDYPLNEDGTVF